MMTDPIADMLSRLRNGLAAGKQEVVVPMSKIKLQIAKILEREGMIKRVSVEKMAFLKNQSTSYDILRLGLRYKKSGRPAISLLKRISKPEARYYAGKSELPRVLNNLGFAIISTSQGIMTNREAKKNGLGGEVICEIY